MGLGTEPWSVSRKTPIQKGRTAATLFGLIALTGAFSVFAVTYSGAFQTWVYSRYPTIFSAARGFSTVARQGLAISLADNLLHVPLLYLPTFYLAVGTMQVTKSRKEDLALFSLRRERAHDGVSQTASTELRRSLQGKTPADIWVDVKAASHMLNTSLAVGARTAHYLIRQNIEGSRLLLTRPPTWTRSRRACCSARACTGPRTLNAVGLMLASRRGEGLAHPQPSLPQVCLLLWGPLQAPNLLSQVRKREWLLLTPAYLTSGAQLLCCPRGKPRVVCECGQFSLECGLGLPHRIARLARGGPHPAEVGDNRAAPLAQPRRRAPPALGDSRGGEETRGERVRGRSPRQTIRVPSLRCVQALSK